MSNSIELLISEIRRHAQKSVNPQLLDETLDEVRAHLDAAIQARMELGLPPDLAEREAVRSFGDPRDFIDDIIGEAKCGPLFDPGVSIAITIAVLVAAIGSPFLQGSTSFWAGAIPVAILLTLVGWRGWKAARIPIAPTIAAFLLGIPAFTFSHLYTFGSGHLHWQNGAETSLSVAAFLGAVSLTTWFIGALLRGDVQRDLKRQLRPSNVHPLKRKHVAQLAVLSGVSIALVIAAMDGWDSFRFEQWAIFAIWACVITGAVFGWRSGRFGLKKLIASAASSIPIGVALLSAYVVSPEGIIIPRSESRQHEAREEPATWMRTQQGRMQTFLDAERAAVAKGPPYKVHVTSLAPEGPTKTVATLAEAESLLRAYERKEQAKLDRAAPFIAQGHKEWQRLNNTPYVLNALMLTRLALWRGSLVWVCVLIAFGIGALLRTFHIRSHRKRGLAS